jgi:hypothetical protein
MLTVKFSGLVINLFENTAGPIQERNDYFLPVLSGNFRWPFIAMTDLHNLAASGSLNPASGQNTKSLALSGDCREAAHSPLIQLDAIGSCALLFPEQYHPDVRMADGKVYHPPAISSSTGPLICWRMQL